MAEVSVNEMPSNCTVAGLGKLRMGARVCSDQSAPSGLPSIDLSAIRIGRRLLELIVS